MLTIGQLAKEADVHVETVRYYERRGLVPEPPRTPSGYRSYPVESVARIRFIKSAQALGFSLAEIEQLLALRVDATNSCAAVQRQGQAKLASIDEKIATLQHMRAAVVELLSRCDREGALGSECPFLEALEGVGMKDDGRLTTND